MSLSTLLYTLGFGKFVVKMILIINIIVIQKIFLIKILNDGVIFNGKIEATKVPPHWHAWLHKTIEDPTFKLFS